jgi:hypothetical protein
MGDSHEKHFICNPEVAWKDIGGEIVLVHLETNKIYELNRTGARLWKLLEEGSSRSDAEAILVREYGIDEETVHAETAALIDELLRQKLVEER